jgi:catalase
VAFCVAHVVPGIDFSNDPLLAVAFIRTSTRRFHAWGRSNFHEIPINAPIAQVHNNQRDGIIVQAIHRGRVSYEPNSLGGGCPFQAGRRRASSRFRNLGGERHKVAREGRAVADHYTQATLFWNSQTDVEEAAHHQRFRFELSRVQTPAIRQRMVSGLMNVAADLATRVAAGLGIREMPTAMPKVMTRDVTPEVSLSPALSLFARPGDGSIRTRRVAILVADGCDGVALAALADRLTSEGAVPRFVSTKLGSVQAAAGDAIEVDVSLEAAPAVLYDAVVLLDGDEAMSALRADGRTLEFIKDQYRHCKPILALGPGKQLLDACGIDATLPDGQPDPGLIIASDTSGRPTTSSAPSPNIGTSREKPTHHACESAAGQHRFRESEERRCPRRTPASKPPPAGDWLLCRLAVALPLQ